MRAILRVFLLAAVCGILFVETASSQRHCSASLPFTLEITANHRVGDSLHWDFKNTSEKAVEVGSVLVVRVRKTNCSDDNLPKSPADGGPYPYQFEVHDSHGNLLESKMSGVIHRRIGGPGLLRGSKDMFLQPGESETSSTRISDFYDMSKPGVYTIQVEQHVSNDPKSAMVQSNIIKIRVLPAK